jgi:hypothetical protein
MQSVPIITNVAISNHAPGEVYSIQHYVLTFVSDLRQVGCILWILRFPQTNQTDRHDIAEKFQREKDYKKYHIAERKRSLMK